jgi:hypothetical protein
MDKTANVFDWDIIKRIVTFVPVAVESKNLFVKRGIKSKGDFNREIIKISNHLLTDISEFIHDRLPGTHGRNIERTLVCIIRRGEKREIVPDLFNDERTTEKNFSAFRVGHDISDIITKRLIEGSGFSVKNANIHFYSFLSRRVTSFLS